MKGKGTHLLSSAEGAPARERIQVQLRVLEVACARRIVRTKKGNKRQSQAIPVLSLMPTMFFGYCARSRCDKNNGRPLSIARGNKPGPNPS